MNSLLGQIWQFNVELSLLLLMVLTSRFVIRKTTKSYNAYLLWLAIPAGYLIAKSLAYVEFSTTKNVFVNEVVQTFVYSSPQSTNDYSLLVWSWLLISGLLLCRLLWQHYQLRKQLKSIQTDTKLSYPESKYPIITIDAKEMSPAVYGFIIPKIYFPLHVAKKLSEQQRQLIIKHEEHHIKQKHLWLNLIWDIAVACVWFNPLIYISRQQFRHDQELFCDYLVLNRSTKQGQKAYGHALLTTVSATHSVSLLCSWKMFNQIEERIMNINNPIGFKSKVAIAVSSLLIVACSAVYAANKQSLLTNNQVFKEQANLTEKFPGELYVAQRIPVEPESSIRRFVREKPTESHDTEQFYIIDDSGKKHLMSEQELREFERASEKLQRKSEESEAKIRLLEEEHELEARKAEVLTRKFELEHKKAEELARVLERKHSNSERALEMSKQRQIKVQEQLAVAHEKIEAEQKKLEEKHELLEQQKMQLRKRLQQKDPVAPTSPIRTYKADKNFPLKAVILPPPPQPATKKLTLPPPPPAPAVAKPIKTVPPVYPEQASKDGIEGFVEFMFDLDKQGKPKNIFLVDSQPEDIFDKAGLDAIQQWRFKSDDDGVRGLKYKINFVLAPAVLSNNQQHKSEHSEHKGKLLPYMPQPTYPGDAAIDNVSGYVEVGFDINAKGETFNIQVIDSSDQELFAQAGIDAIEQWRFSPSSTGVEGNRYRFNFQLPMSKKKGFNLIQQARSTRSNWSSKQFYKDGTMNKINAVGERYSPHVIKN